MIPYQTKNMGFAAALSFVGKRHLSTIIEPSGRVAFLFEDADGTPCSDIALQFFGDGMITNDARYLLECMRTVKKTITHAIRVECQRWDAA